MASVALRPSLSTRRSLGVDIGPSYILDYHSSQGFGIVWYLMSCKISIINRTTHIFLVSPLCWALEPEDGPYVYGVPYREDPVRVPLWN